MDYCRERSLGINRCGKLVVAKNADELPVLDMRSQLRLPEPCHAESAFQQIEKLMDFPEKRRYESIA